MVQMYIQLMCHFLSKLKNRFVLFYIYKILERNKKVHFRAEIVWACKTRLIDI